MANYSTNEFKAGLKVMLDGDPCSIVENELVKPGKGQAFNRVKLRNLMTGRVGEKTFKSGDSLEGADVMDLEMEYLYTDGDMWYFMKTDGSFEQYAVEKKALGDTVKWLKEQVPYILTCQQGVQKLHRRRHYLVVAPAMVKIKQRTAQLFHAACLRRQHLIHAVGQ